MQRKTIIIGIFLILAAGALLIWRDEVFTRVPVFFTDKSEESGQSVEPASKDLLISLEITEGTTYTQLMEEAGVAAQEAREIFLAASNVYNLENVRQGRALELVIDRETNELKQLVYQISTEEKLYVTSQASADFPAEGGGELAPDTTYNFDTATATDSELASLDRQGAFWLAERKPIEYEVAVKTTEGVIETSMYEAALAQGIDERAIIEFANVFQWAVDFAWEVRVGDKFKFIYEERYLEGEYIMPGRILAGRFDNQAKTHFAYYFSDRQISGYYDPAGNSVRRIFLKTPVDFKYISSGYTTSPRYVEAFQQYTSSHKAIDYAASAGTPVRAVGDGTVAYATWNGSYGNEVSIRHSSNYTTNYAHLSKFAVTKGQAVSQGQTIGYVGSTGYSTGPHLHYEMLKNGVKINPLTEELPPGEPLSTELLPQFEQLVAQYQPQLD